jgi:DNA polymerase/3'-5' exonuclease PolX
VLFSWILRQIAYLIELEAQDNNKEADKNKSNIVFEIRAYRRTADIIENLSSNVEEIYYKWKLKGLIAISSIGKAIALKNRRSMFRQEKLSILKS